MKFDELKQRYPFAEAEDVNSLRVAESHFFNHTTTDSRYRELAVESVIRDELSFRSTGNSYMEVAKRLVEITCPSCQRGMLVVGGGSSGGSCTVNYRCDYLGCKTEVSLTMPPDGLSVQFKGKASDA